MDKKKYTRDLEKRQYLIQRDKRVKQRHDKL